MRFDVFEQYKKIQVQSIGAADFKLPENVKILFKNQNAAIPVQKTTGLRTLLGVYFTPVDKTGKTRANGAGIGTRIRAGEYAFSTLNAVVPPPYHIDVLVTWKDGQVTAVWMSPDAAQDFSDVLAGKAKPKRGKKVDQTDLYDQIEMEDPQITADKLKAYSSIKGEGNATDFGYVWGVIDGRTERYVIPSDMMPFLKEREKIPFSNSVLRTFDVVIPPVEQKKYEAYLAIAECQRLRSEAIDALAVVEQKYRDTLEADPAFIKVRKAHEDALKEIQEAKAAFEKLQQPSA